MAESGERVYSVVIARFSTDDDVAEFARLMQEAAAFNFAGWLFVPTERLVIERDGKEVSLTAKETAILEHLVKNFPRAYTGAQLADVVDSDFNSVKVHAARMRKKLSGHVITDGRNGQRYRFSGVPKED